MGSLERTLQLLETSRDPTQPLHSDLQNERVWYWLQRKLGTPQPLQAPWPAASGWQWDEQRRAALRVARKGSLALLLLWRPAHCSLCTLVGCDGRAVTVQLPSLPGRYFEGTALEAVVSVTAEGALELQLTDTLALWGESVQQLPWHRRWSMAKMLAQHAAAPGKAMASLSIAEPTDAGKLTRDGVALCKRSREDYGCTAPFWVTGRG